ncbi:MAG: hypothetical protein Kow0029_28460 [Candidatus Rifleibacteriota bacterium]
MTGEEYLANELKKYKSICYYPSSGSDLSDLDYFCSGMKPREERAEASPGKNNVSVDSNIFAEIPDLFIHTDVNFYHEFESGFDFPADECGIHGDFHVVEFKELPSLKNPNIICDNLEYSGKCFEYKLKLWGSENIRTLIFCLCENEHMVSKIFLDNNIHVSFIWSKNWNGSQTYGTWMVNILDRLCTRKVYTDWLCVPGFKGQPGNKPVASKYPELMVEAKVKLVRNNNTHWIEEGSHGWVEEFDVVPKQVSKC